MIESAFLSSTRKGVKQIVVAMVIHLVFLIPVLAQTIPAATATAAITKEAATGPLNSPYMVSDIRLPTVTPDMVHYSRIRYGLYFLSIAYELLLWLAIMQLGISNSLRNFARRAAKGVNKQIILYFVMLCSLTFVCSIPLLWWGGFWLDHQYRQSTQSVAGWLADRLKNLAVSILTTTAGFLCFFGLVRRFPRHWPIFLWLISIPCVAILIFAEPLVIDPLFNSFAPMKECQLRKQIEKLADRAGIKGATILVADKSKQTEKLNAYVTGMGNSARIVIWDTTISKLPAPQVLAVVGHEMGHYVLGHIYLGFAVGVVLSFLFVPFNYLFARKLIRCLPHSWGVRRLEDYAVTPVVLAAIALAGFLLAPAINLLSRYQEHQADAFGLRLTQDRASMAKLFVSLSEKNLSEPDPPTWIKFWLCSHPTLKERIEFALGRPVDR